MKSLEELNKIREQALKRVNLRQESKEDYRILIGMATCGIASGARPVLKQFMDCLEKDPQPIIIQQTGCIGMCQFEPIVEVVDKEGEKTTYFKVNPQIAKEIYQEHIKNHRVIHEYTRAHYEKALEE
jgi:NADP-reducing hydrogenase subunit HndB